MHLGLLQQPPAPAQSEDRSANQKTTFFDNIGEGLANLIH
jgi:hypothetical protein